MAEGSAPLLGGSEGSGGRRGSVNMLTKPDEYLSPLERTMGIVGSVASVMNAVIGTGILALPVAFSRVGVGLGIVVMVVCAIVCFFSLVGLGQVITEVGGTSYGNTMDIAVGGPSGTIVSLIVLAFCWGVCVIYSVVISSNLTDLLFEQEIITGRIIPGIENRQFWILATTFGVLIPLCMLPNFDKLKYAAMFATSSMVYLTGVIAGFLILSATRAAVPVWEAGIEPVPGAAEGVRTPIGPRDSRVTSPLLHPEICCVPLYTADQLVPGCDLGTEPACCAATAGEVCCTEEVLANGVLQWSGSEAWILDFSDPGDIFSSFSTFLFAFLTHTMVPQVVAELIEPSTVRLSMMMGGVCIGSLGLYLVVGITGYVLFGACVCDNISVSFGPSVLVAIGQGFVVTSVCCGYATLCWPCRDAILDLCYPLYLRAIGEAPAAAPADQNSAYSAVTAAPPDSLAPGSDAPAAAMTASKPNTSGKVRQPSMLLKRAVALLIIFSASTVAWFDPPFGAVISILGAVGGGLCGFVMPSLSYMQIYHGEKTRVRRLFCTLPGWCLICSSIFFVVNTYFVLDEVFFPGEGEGQNRACAPIDD